MYNSCILIIGILIQTQLYAQQFPNWFEHTTDIGRTQFAGVTSYDSERQVYTLKGAGTGLGISLDALHFSYTTLSGDFILRARIQWGVEKIGPTQQIGWMVRTGLEPDAAMVGTYMQGNGQAVVRFRKQLGAKAQEIIPPVKNLSVIQLERRGKSFHFSLAEKGTPFWTVEIPGFEFPEALLAGLFINRGDHQEEAIVDNVRIVLPALSDIRETGEYIGSHIEVLDVVTGRRKILHTASNSLQAPNWTLDNQYLIYNSEGLLYTLKLSDGTIEVLPTDYVDKNNNDHVLSFDGKTLAISSSSGEKEYGSLIYTVPVEGGVPKRITPLGPSYLHGWSPDGKWLTYTARRNGAFDIYKIPADGSGPEIQLTDFPTLDDGPEYSPDGAYIYFNSARAGSMDLWRMQPDGSAPEQLTNDALQNWFPHLSPDGKTMVFISYLPEIHPEDHPFYKRVYLRKMSVEGGIPEVIAYLYGGQGTINVPSWSPDGRFIAFVSNTRMK